ncbi:tRNA (cytidine(34)-2'-O)-methyltransferase [Prochlorococcus sp. MIT 1223]|uniref:tRNA (cytidine(34)-2'-O)-methyltransferase n=1 Tax=Prochlorococcus sp. MIT 1223 TaxID=3096217 RepID=UPI002A754584|nr:tRNA (cytidine(34)-2'-O)-methyltransferase [Prochlorococcus sp. MIT 1223]
MIAIKPRSQFRIALFEPRIPQNTGNIARTCAAFNLKLDLIKPLGFTLEDKYLKRAGLDYWQYMDIRVHENFDKFCSSITSSRLLALSKSSTTSIASFKLLEDDVFIFGREDNGLPNFVRDKCSTVLSIPMPCGAYKQGDKGVRSLNLSVACGIVAYEAMKQKY